MVVTPDVIGQFAAEAGSQSFAGRTTVAYGMWKSRSSPSRSCRHSRRIARSGSIADFTRAAVAVVTDEPVLATPSPVVPPQVDERADRFLLRLTEGFLSSCAYLVLRAGMTEVPEGAAPIRRGTRERGTREPGRPAL